MFHKPGEKYRPKCLNLAVRRCLGLLVSLEHQSMYVKYEYKIDVNHAVALEANGLRSGIKSLYKGITMKVMMFIPHLMFHRVGELNLWCL